MRAAKRDAKATEAPAKDATFYRNVLRQILTTYPGSGLWGDERVGSPYAIEWNVHRIARLALGPEDEVVMKLHAELTGSGA